LGSGDGYLYPHNYQGHYVSQQYLPDPLKRRRYYEPSESGRERHIKTFLALLKKGTTKNET
jgi:putative ATPase